MLDAARGGRGVPDPGREGAGRRARGHRRRHHRPRDLREGLALAHRGAPGRRRALHQRHRGRRCARRCPRRRRSRRSTAARSPRMVPEEDSIEVPSVGGRKPRIMARQILGDVLQPRAEEICQLVARPRSGAPASSAASTAGVVLTGGGAILEGMPEIAEQIFDMPVRRGTPGGHRRPRGRRGEPGLRDGGGPRAVRLSQPCRARARRRASGGDGDLRQGHRAPHGLAVRLLLTGGDMERSAKAPPFRRCPCADPRVARATARARSGERRRRAPVRDVRDCRGRLPLQAHLPPLRVHDRLFRGDLRA